MTKNEKGKPNSQFSFSGGIKSPCAFNAFVLTHFCQACEMFAYSISNSII